ncbi:hypothetical protein [Xanthocytophaga flava]|uniref:hypothetical protein n=1 Tax=Xanthocytophaga flava TaxID=3048013 RepID=UPI0028D505D5|nr:hypothetical protein [Xanthocytophaga flavus]
MSAKPKPIPFISVGLGLFLRNFFNYVCFLLQTSLYLRLLHFLLAQKMKQKRAPFPDPSARMAKGQPRGKRIAYAPTLPHTIEGMFALFVAYFITFSRTPFYLNSGLLMLESVLWYQRLNTATDRNR